MSTFVESSALETDSAELVKEELEQESQAQLFPKLGSQATPTMTVSKVVKT